MALKKTVDFYLVVVLSFSLFVNLGLGLKVHKLNLLLTPRPLPQLAVSSKVESLDALDISGKSRHVVLNSGVKPVVLYIFSPTCGWCAKNLKNIKEIYHLKNSDFEFIGVSLAPNGIPEYIAQTGFPLDVVKEPSEASKQVFHLDETPETIVVDPSGTIAQVWPGAYSSSKTCRKIERFFQMPAGSLTPIS